MRKARQARRIELPAWLVGVALAGALALAVWLGVPALQVAEGAALDWLFRYGRPSAPPPSPSIVHVDIDDKALDSVGRWPWKRARLAEALQVMDELGARVIALDILLLEPQDPEYLKDGGVIDHDRLLTDTFKKMRARVLLAVHGGEELRAWPELRVLLHEDITVTPESILRRLTLTAERARLVRVRLREFKRQVIREVAADLGTRGILTVAAMRDELLRESDRGLGEFPELNLIRAAVAREQATIAFSRRLPEAPEGLPAIRNLLTPLPRFADAVHGLGVVNPSQDPDGRLRRSDLRWSYRGRVYPQLGLAAAALFLEQPPSTLARPDLVVGKAEFGRGPHVLSWPRIDPERGELGSIPHLSIGSVLSIVRAGRKIATDRAELAPVVKELLTRLEDIDPEDPHEELVEQADFWDVAREQPPEDETVGTDDERGQKRSRNLLREYLRRTHELAEGERGLERGRHRLGIALKDKLVFVGANATGNFGDFYPTVLGKRTPGVVAHGIIANAALTGYVVHPTSLALAAFVTLLLGVAAAVVTTRLGPRLAFLVVLLVGIAYFAFDTIVVFGAETALALVTPLSGLGVAWAGTQVMRNVTERREKAALRRQFGSRMSPQLFEFLTKNPEQLHLEGEEREVTCFFSDLAGFTAISESLDSTMTVRVLNRYMFEMNRALCDQLGYVNKFLGDGVMAVWGAFELDTPHAERACLGALACLRRLRQLNDELTGLPELKMRIGIATGVVTIGDCGAPPDLRDYTVIGDSANLAARLESANKQFDTRILVNGRCKSLLGDNLLTRPLGTITVVGQKTPTEIHELLAERDLATPEQEALAKRSARSVELFQDGEFDAAREAFAEIEAHHGPSKWVRLYMDAIGKTRLQDFDGVLHLERK